ncbi:MAG: BMP family ABC transporter substrate-binding protein [Oscillospiraceae bacterium]|nr:BMP family ABC transporter substrate-binding protein [Oscillospiraceae bacterium]MBR2889922.1 BMP family ABC transporter substrate-binding protein [Oscillospiraceae bacterium]
MKKFLALLLAVVMVLGLVACGEKTPETTAPQGGENQPADTKPAESTPVVSESEYKVAMITDYGDITDQSFNQTTYEACKEYCDANDVKFAYYKPIGDSDAERIAMVDAAVMDGYNIVVLPGFAFAPTVVEVCQMYPDVKFIALDVALGDLLAAAVGESYDYNPDNWNLADYVDMSNVYCAVYQEELSGYMAGYAAVKMGYKHFGYLGGMAVPAVMRFGYGFLQGIDAAAAELGNTAEIVVEYVYGNQFFGDADITAVMDTWYGEKGVECVFACGGGIYTSAAEAAAKVGGKVIGVDVDQSAIIDPKYGEGMTITSAMKGLAPTVKDTLKDVIENGNWAAYSGKIANLGLVSADPETNYVQIPMEATHWCDAFTQEDYKALVAGMFDGTITVSPDFSVMPTVGFTVNEYPNIK